MNANETMREKKGTPRWQLAAFLLVFAVVFGSLIPPFLPLGPTHKSVIAGQDIIYIRSALKSYFNQFDALPVGDHAAIVAALRGKNPSKIVFWEVDGKHFNALGECVDPWGHPYHIDVSNPEAPRVYSFGKNGVDEGGAVGSDDVVSWR